MIRIEKINTLYQNNQKLTSDTKAKRHESTVSHSAPAMEILQDDGFEEASIFISQSNRKRNKGEDKLNDLREKSIGYEELDARMEEIKIILDTSSSTGDRERKDRAQEILQNAIDNGKFDADAYSKALDGSPADTKYLLNELALTSLVRSGTNDMAAISSLIADQNAVLRENTTDILSTVNIGGALAQLPSQYRDPLKSLYKENIMEYKNCMSTFDSIVDHMKEKTLNNFKVSVEFMNSAIKDDLAASSRLLTTSSVDKIQLSHMQNDLRMISAVRDVVSDFSNSNLV